MASQPAPIGIGAPMRRVDGRLKVTGTATYTGETTLENVAYAVIVEAQSPAGKLQSLDLSGAKACKGVLTILTPDDKPKMATPKKDMMSGGGLLGEKRVPLADHDIFYVGQAIAVVVAETFEIATHAASLVKASIEPAKHFTKLSDATEQFDPPQSMGEPVQMKRGSEAIPVSGAIATAGGLYELPIYTHNPIEPSATLAKWDGDRLTVWDATQFMKGTQGVLAEIFGVPDENVRVLCPFVGGAFGCKGGQWPHTFLAAAAAKVVGRPVKLVLKRQQMFTMTGHRPQFDQTLRLLANPDGKLIQLTHDATQADSWVGDYVEPCAARTSGFMYASPNLQAKQTVKRLHLSTPTFMRAPGEAPGMFALESAMDELAATLGIDPIELRTRNHADKHPVLDKPWSGKHLTECFTLGAEKFGWSKRKPNPGEMRDGNSLVGYGVAAATYPAYRFPSAARITLKLDGDTVRAEAASATHDLGTGAYTAFTQITATELGLPPDRVKFTLGDSALPPAPVAGGSTSTASVGQALHDAASMLKQQLLGLAKDSPLAGLKPQEVEFADGMLVHATYAPRKVSLAELLKKADRLTLTATAVPPQPGRGPAEPGSAAHFDGLRQQFAMQSFGAHFVEVAIDPMLPRVRVRRVVTVIDNGKVINPLTSRSQVIGGVIMGMGMALTEATHVDHRFGRQMNHSLGEYEVMTNADVISIEPFFIDKPDLNMNAQGSRGVGEIGITGVAAAIANAVYHATGVRIRSLPITPDKLIGQIKLPGVTA